MSENITTDGSYKSAIALLEDLDARRQALDEDGVTVNTECTHCGDPIAVELLPSESPEGTICRECVKYKTETSL